MAVAAAHVYRYALPLTAPLRTADAARAERTGLLLRLDGDDGGTGWGEAAPLPGFSAESPAAAAEALTAVASRLPGSEAEAGGGDLPVLPAAVRFAVEGARLGLRAAAGPRSVPQLLGAAGPSVSINALVPADETDAAAEARRLAARGFRAVKVKVGGGDLEADVRRVRAVAGALGPAVRLRLDANRAWTPAEAVSFFEALGGVPIEYIEEPLADPEALPSFAAETGRPVALDETTREHGPAVLEALAPVAAVVLKPTLLGGLAATREWARAAREHDATPVVSAAYESGVGLRLLAAQAAALSDAPAGLSTYARLADDVLSPRLPLDGPSAPLDRLFEGTVDETHLDRLHSAH